MSAADRNLPAATKRIRQKQLPPSELDRVDADMAEAVNGVLEAKDAPGVPKMWAKLATYTYYVPSLSVDNFACYTCPGSAPKTFWSGFSGPSCKPKNVSQSDSLALEGLAGQ